MENLNLPDFSQYAKGFSESKFWDKLAAFAKSAGLKVVAAALLLYYVLKSEDTPRADKAKIVGALGYFILPVDIIPDFIPVAGFTDDLAALTWGIWSVAKNITPEIKDQTRLKLRDWFKDMDEEELKGIL